MTRSIEKLELADTTGTAPTVSGSIVILMTGSCASEEWYVHFLNHMGERSLSVSAFVGVSGLDGSFLGTRTAAAARPPHVRPVRRFLHLSHRKRTACRRGEVALFRIGARPNRGFNPDICYVFTLPREYDATPSSLRSSLAALPSPLVPAMYQAGAVQLLCRDPSVGNIVVCTHLR